MQAKSRDRRGAVRTAPRRSPLFFQWSLCMAATPTLNERALRLADHIAATAAALRVNVETLSSGARILDCGVKTPGSLQAGLALARVCLAGQAEVSLVPGEVGGAGCPQVQIVTDQPVLACMAAQYAGWP